MIRTPDAMLNNSFGDRSGQNIFNIDPLRRAAASLAGGAGAGLAFGGFSRPASCIVDRVVLRCLAVS
jgi:hypothetical protein